MARALITFTTFNDFFSIIRAPVSRFPTWAVTTNSASSEVASTIFIVRKSVAGLFISCVSYPK